MTIRQGTLLERNVQRIFNSAGFQTQHQLRINDYEIDVYAERDQFSVAIECKQYEKSNINIRNLIHLWNSKNNEIKASKVLLVLFGFDVPDFYHQLAERYSMKIWDQDDVDYFMDLMVDDKEKLRKSLFHNLGITENERDKLAEETKKMLEIAKKSGKNEDNVTAIETVVENGIKQVKLFMNDLEIYLEQGLDVKEILSSTKEVIDALYSSVYSTILASLKNSFFAPQNQDKIPEKEIKEFNKFLKKWDKYTLEEDRIYLLKDNYNKLKKEILKLDNKGKIENFHKILENVENLFNIHNMISKIDELDNNFKLFCEAKNLK